MKWRINQNMIRIRLSDEDTQKLKEGVELVESLPFTGKAYRYRLMLAEENQATLDSDSIIITINSKAILKEGDISVEWESTEGLKVLVESDLYG